MIGRPDPLDPQAVFNEFWADIVQPAGLWDYEQILKELCDYHMLLTMVPKVYDHISGGSISKPNTLAEEVIAEHDRHWHWGEDCDEEAAQRDGDVRS